MLQFSFIWSWQGNVFFDFLSSMEYSNAFHILFVLCRKMYEIQWNKKERTQFDIQCCTFYLCSKNGNFVIAVVILEKDEIYIQYSNENVNHEILISALAISQIICSRYTLKLWPAVIHNPCNMFLVHLFSWPAVILRTVICLYFTYIPLPVVRHSTVY